MENKILESILLLFQIKKFCLSHSLLAAVLLDVLSFLNSSSGGQIDFFIFFKKSDHH